MKVFAIVGLALSGASLSLLAGDKHDATHVSVGRERDPAKGLNFYSIEKEIALGRQMAEGVEKQSKLVRDPVVVEYVNRVVQNLVRNSDAKVPFSIQVIDSSEVNAFALPGGFMFVNTGLITQVEGEAELAGVLAHEIAHVAARHATKQATRGTILNYATVPLVFMGGWGIVIQGAINLAGPVGFLHFSRAMEGEADRLGLQYMYRAGYDPNAFTDFFERIESLEKRKPGTISKVFATHPPTRARVRRAQQVIQNELKPLSQYVLDTSEFHGVQERIVSVSPGHPGRELRLRRLNHDGVDNGKPPDPQDGEGPTLKRRN